MNLKQFLKPDKRKILTSLLLAVIAAFLTFMPLLSYVIFPFYFAMILFYNIPIYFTVIIFILVSYPFGCYIAQNRRWLKVIFLYLITFVIISAGITFAISGYNKVFGHSCNSDFDCKFICGAGAVNDKFIYLKDPFVRIDCATTVAICGSSKCKTLRLMDATTIEECERIRRKGPYYGEMCYFTLARKLNDKSLCDKISTTSLKENCIKGEF